MAEHQVQVHTYQARYAADFARLNYEWIETHFKIEKIDRDQLEAPEEKILSRGGEIFFLLEGENVVGTCALIPHGFRGYELAKMAVSPQRRGRGYGDLLMKNALAWAAQKGAREVMLLSNTRLESAISLYRKHGFEVVHLGTHPDYERCNIEMLHRLDFDMR